MPVVLALRRLKQEDLEFEANLVFETLSQNTTKKN
jgi:hypothetical protein